MHGWPAPAKICRRQFEWWISNRLLVLILRVSLRVTRGYFVTRYAEEVVLVPTFALSRGLQFRPKSCCRNAALRGLLPLTPEPLLLFSLQGCSMRGQTVLHGVVTEVEVALRGFDCHDCKLGTKITSKQSTI